MKKPLLIFATEGEAAPVRVARPDLDIAICGVGVVESAVSVAKIIESMRPDAVVLCGIAGAYSDALKVGDVVAVSEERCSTLPSVYRKSYLATIKLPLTEVVSNTVMAVGAEAMGAQIENMEGAAIFALCVAYGVPCAEIRTISNYTTDIREQWNIPVALEALVKAVNMLF